MSAVVESLRWPSRELPARLAVADAIVCSARLAPTAESVASSLAQLSREERERFHASANQVVAGRFVVGRAILREILGAVLGVAPAAVPIRAGAHGKPFIPAIADAPPLWFSVAHTDDLLLVAVSVVAEVGVDVERVRAVPGWERVADRVLAPFERAQLAREVQAGADAEVAFLGQWCRVEAELKAIGAGIVGLEAHRLGLQPRGLRVTDLPGCWDDGGAASGVRYAVSVALCEPAAPSERQMIVATAHDALPTVAPASASTA